ncbi:hypothetical protein H311_02514 [Anncaliia algerae PRA109]|nr:hypothetical protein H311_02514 [Anncaliia algerae PRA109]
MRPQDQERRGRRTNDRARPMDQGMSDFIREVFNSEITNVNFLLGLLTEPASTATNQEIRFTFTNSENNLFDRVFDFFDRPVEEERRSRRGRSRRRENHNNFIGDIFDRLLQRIRLLNSTAPDLFNFNNIFTIFTINFNPKPEPKVVNKENIDKIKKERYNSTAKIPCPICYSNFKKGEEIRCLDCSHKYHRKCIDPWLLNSSDTCPTCRKTVLKEE